MSELKAGDRGFLPIEIADIAESLGVDSRVLVMTTMKDGHGNHEFWIDPKEIIPVSPPLDAPDGEGMWMNRIHGQCYARHVISRDFGHDVGYWDLGWVPIAKAMGTWEKIHDGLFGAGEVEGSTDAPKPCNCAAHATLETLLRLQGETIAEMQRHIQAGIARESGCDEAQ